MQKAQGPNLEDLLYEKVEIAGKKTARRRAIEPFAALSMAIGICQRVDQLHINGVIHRDLKPNNIHLAPDGEIQIIDMGEAYLTTGPVGETKVKEAGEIKGTRQYIAPEIEGEESQYSAKTDSYAVGMVFIEIFTDFNVLQRGYELEREGKYKTVELQGKAVQEEMLKALQAKLKNPNLSQEEKDLFKHLQKMTSRKSGDRPDLNEDIIVLCNLAIKHLQNNPHASSLLSRSSDVAINDFKTMKITAQLRQFQQKYPEVLKANREVSADLVGILMNIEKNDSHQATALMSFIDKLDSDVKKIDTGVLGFSAKTAKNELKAIISDLRTLSFAESKENIMTVNAVVTTEQNQSRSSVSTLRFANDLPDRDEPKKVLSSPRGTNQNITPLVDSKESLAMRGQKRRSSILTSYGQLETIKNKSQTTPSGDDIPKKEKRTSRKFSPD
jgi:serine/threonine protein kinase